MVQVRVSLGFLLLSGAAVAQQYVISTIAGGAPPATPVAAVNTSIGQPYGVATDSSGSVYFISLNCVFKVDSNGVLTRVAGNSRPGYSGDGGPATSAQLTLTAYLEPKGVALDGSGNLYIADEGNQRIRKVSPNGIITTVAGGGTNGLGDGGPATSAQLKTPTGVAVDGSGNLYIVDYNTVSVRKVSPGGIITTVAGNGTNGYSGDGGPATSAEFSFPFGVAVDGFGNLYIADSLNSRIRKVSPSGTITTVAGNGTFGYSGDGGLATAAQLDNPYGVTLDASGNLYIADQSNQRIRKVSPTGIITTVAGGSYTGPGLGDGGLATSAQLTYPYGAAVDGSGNLYIADTYDRRIRRVSPSGIITTVAGNGAGGFYGMGGYSGDGGPATSAELNGPEDVAADGSGNLYVVDSRNNCIRKVSPSGTITTVAGNGTAGYSGDGGLATSAQLSNPYGVAADLSGNLYIADTGNNRSRRVSINGIITTVAGNGTSGYSGDGGLATSAELNNPVDVAADGSGNLYIADSFRVRKVSPAGIITTVAGNGGVGSSGDGGPATSAQLTPRSVAVDGSGNLYIADLNDHSIRKVSPGGTITTVATPSSSFGLAVDGSGNLYIASNYSVLKVPPNSTVATVAGNGTCCYSGDGGPATIAQVSPSGLAVDAAGKVYVADAFANAVRLLTPVTISPVSIVTTSPLPPGRVNVAYSQTLTASGGTAPYANWAIIGGAQPTGLNLSTVGVLSGTPTTAGTYNFTVRVTDSASATASASFQLTISPSPLTITTLSPLPAGQANTAYSQALAASGGTPPYTSWVFTGGTQPPGLSLGSGGVLNGTPTTAGTYNFTVQVTDSANATASASFQLVINASSLAIITTSPLPVGNVGVPYSQALSATGGATPYKSWVVTAGSLPPGISLTTLGGVLGALLSGVPTAPGTFTFTVQVTDSAGATASKQFSLSINASGPVFPTNGIVNAANYVGGGVSPGEIVVIFGSGMGPTTLVGLQLDSNGNVAKTLAGVQVLFDSLAAPLVYVQANQVSAVVPYEVSGKTATQVQVVYQGQTSAAQTVPVVSAVPGIFTVDYSGKGPGAILNQDGTLNSASNPAAPGSYVFVYGTGEGQTNPKGVDGTLDGSPAPQPVQKVTGTIGGISATVQYAGGSPGLVAGVLQVNLLVPQTVTPGNAVPVVINIGGATSQPGVTIAVR